MIGTAWQKRVLALRREQRDMLRRGWEFIGEGGGRLWELSRGSRIGYRVVAAQPSLDGLGVWVLVQDTAAIDAKRRHDLWEWEGSPGLLTP